MIESVARSVVESVAGLSTGLTYIKEGRALDLGNLGATTVPDLSGNGNVITQKTGIYASTDGVDDYLFFNSSTGSGIDLTAAGLISQIQVKTRAASGVVFRFSLDGTNLAITSQTLSNEWEEHTITFVPQIADDFYAWTSGGGGDWSDVRVTGATHSPRYQLNESGAASLDGYPVFDSSGNGYNGTHTGGAGGDGEGIADDVRGIVGYDNFMFFDGVDDYVQTSNLNETLNTASVTFFTPVDINSSSSAKALLCWDNAGNATSLHVGGGTSLLTNEVIWIGDGNRRTGVVNITIPAGFNTISLTWNSGAGRYDIILNGVTQTVTLGTSTGHVSQQTALVCNIGSAASAPSALYDNLIEAASFNSNVYNNAEDWNGATVNGSPVTVGQKRATILQTAGLDWNKYSSGEKAGTFSIFNCRRIKIEFEALEEINSSSTASLLRFDTSDSGNSIYLGNWTGLLTNEVITIGSINRRTGVVGTTLTKGRHTIEFISTDDSIFEIELDGVSQPVENAGGGVRGVDVDWADASINFSSKRHIITSLEIYDSSDTLSSSYVRGNDSDQTGSVDLSGGDFLLIPESDTTAGEDVLGNPIDVRRPNSRVANMLDDASHLLITDDASLDSQNVFACWFYYDGTDGVIVDYSDGAGTTKIETSSGNLVATGLTSPTYYVGNKTTAIANTAALTENAWNYIAVTFSDFTPTADQRIYRRVGHVIQYVEDKALATFEQNRKATKGQY